MEEDLKEQLKKLKEEMERLREEVKAQVGEEKGRPRRRGIYIDVGGPVQDYVEDIMQGVAEGVHGELEKSIFIGPHGCRIFGGRERSHHNEHDEEMSLTKVSEVMSSLGNEHRLKILHELMSGGKYVNELQERLKEITTSTLSSHLDVLENVGLVVQEKVRGRYLITMPGRTAYKMARKVTRFAERRSDENET